MTPPDAGAKVEAAPSASAILLVFLLYVAGTTCNWGFLTWWGLPLVLSAAVLAFWFHVRPRWNGPSPEALLTGIFIACVASNCWLQTGHDQVLLTPDQGWTWAQALASEMLTAPGIAIKLLAGAALLLAVSYLSRSAGWIARRRFAALILIAIAMRMLIMISTPSPEVDVFISQTAGGKGLLEGKNVYEMKFPSPYKTKFVFEIVRGGKKISVEAALDERSDVAPERGFEETEIAPASAARLGLRPEPGPPRDGDRRRAARRRRRASSPETSSGRSPASRASSLTSAIRLRSSIATASPGCCSRTCGRCG